MDDIHTKHSTAQHMRNDGYNFHYSSLIKSITRYRSTYFIRVFFAREQSSCCVLFAWWHHKLFIWIECLTFIKHKAFTPIPLDLLRLPSQEVLLIYCFKCPILYTSTFIYILYLLSRSPFSTLHSLVRMRSCQPPFRMSRFTFLFNNLNHQLFTLISVMGK